MLNISNLNYEIGNNLILKDINLFLAQGEKVGVVGVNGAGKSTLLKLISGNLEVESGNVNLSGSYSYLSQEIHKEIEHEYDYKEMTISEYLIVDQNLDVEEWQINKMINNLNMSDKDGNSIISTLSGGQKIKVELIKILISKPQLLILDEPTNFLDIPSSEWLMKYLINYPGGVLVVSHDLRLMNKALSKIWFVNSLTKSVEVYKGNYEQFLKAKQLQDENIYKSIVNMDRLAKRMFRSAQMLSSRKSDSEAKRAARKFERVKQIKEEISKREDLLRKSKRMKISLPTPPSCSREVLMVDCVSKDYGEQKVLNGVSMEVEKREKIVIIGKNGVGKTTLLKILAGKLNPTSGTYHWGYNTKVGYYAQEYEGLDYKKTVIENVVGNGWNEQEWRSFLGRFLIIGDMVNQKVSTLSGGEKTRLALAKLFSQSLNVLLLDEPTTYLDPQSQDILLEILRDYKGTLIIVSHQPEFVKNLGVDKALLMPEEKLVYFDEKYLDRVGLM